MKTPLFKYLNKKFIFLVLVVGVAGLLLMAGVKAFASASTEELSDNIQDSYFYTSEIINNTDYSVSAVNAIEEASEENCIGLNSDIKELTSNNNNVVDDSANEANVNIRPTDVERSDAGEIIVYTDVNYSTMGAQAAINRLNQLRWEACAEGVRDPRNESRNLTTADYVPIKWSTDMEWIAQTRAAESCFVMDHTRPTGKSCFTCTHNGNSSYAEDLAWNFSGMAQGIEQWYSEKDAWVHKTGGVTGHYTSMINPNYTYFGLGTAKVPTNGYYTTAGEFNSRTGLDEAETPEKGQYKQAMAFQANAFNYKIYYPTTMEARSDEQIGGLAILKQDSSVQFPVKTNDLDYSSSNSSVAEVDEYGYIWAKSAGTTTISIYKENTLSKVEYVLNVTSSTRPEAEVTSTGDASVTLSWDAIDGATQYAVCEYINGNYYTFSDNVKSTTYTCSPIQNEVEHYFLVQAKVNGQWSKYSSVNFVSATPHGRYKPDDVRGSVVGTSVTLSWTAVPAAEKYAIATQNPDGSYTTYTYDCTNTSYTIRNLEEGTQYKCLVQAYFKGDIWSTFSESDLVKVTIKGTRPVVTATASGDGEVTLSWDAIDGADKYAAYEVVGSNYVPINEAIPASTRTIKATDLANNYQHTFLVQAHVGGTWSKFSERNYAYATPTGTVKPTISSAEVTGTNIKLTWNKVPGASKYAIATKVGSSGYTTYTLSETGTSYTIKGLEDGVTYDCLVQANINGKWSAFDSSDLKQATTKGTRPVVTATASGDGEVTLSWDAIDGADKYAAYEVVGSSYVPINEAIPASTHTINATDLANNYQHTFLVQAQVDGVWSKFSSNNYAYATPTGTIKPTISSAEATGTNIKLTWNKVPGASKYAIATKVGSSGYTTYTMSETGTSYTIKGLEDGVTYDCLVQANINGKWSEFSSSDLKQATTKGTRPAPQATTGDGYVTLTWDAIDNATKYVAYEVINGKYVQIGDEIAAPTTTVTKNDLVNEQLHTFLVQAYVGGSWSKFSDKNYVSATPHGTVKPAISSYSSTDATITVNWTYVSGSDGYCAAISTDGSHWTNFMVDKTSTTYTYTGLQSETTYKVLVQRKVGSSWSSFTSSDIKSVTTKQSSRTNYSATGSRENAILCDGSTKSYNCIKVTKTGDGSSEDDDFYGYNAAILAKNRGLLTITDAIITTASKYANAVFSYGTGTTLNISNSKINTSSNNSGGVMVTGGGVLTATDVDATTTGDSSAPIRSDRGGGTLTTNRGTYTSSGKGSPAIYSTAAIKAIGTKLISNHSEGVIVEGKNSATLNNCILTDTNDKLNGQSTSYKNIFLYQSQSGDAEVGTASCSATDSTITTNKGDSFYVTNNTAKIDLTNNTIINNDSSGYLLRAKADAWGKSGKNGGKVTFNLNNQTVSGNIYIDNISTLTMSMNSGSKYTGTINGANTANTLALTLSADSQIVLTGDSYLTSFTDDDSTYSNVDTTHGHLYVNGVLVK